MKNRNEKCNICGRKLKNCEGHGTWFSHHINGLIVLAFVLFLAGYVAYFFDFLGINNSKKAGVTAGNGIYFAEKADKEPQYIKERFKIKEYWFKGVQEVVHQTNDPEATVVYNFLAKSSILSVPVEVEGNPAAQIFEAPRSDDFFLLIPLGAFDSEAGASWQNILSDKRFVGTYLPDLKTMVIKDASQISPIWRGLILLHETRHAMDMFETPYDWQDERQYCEHERDVHIFQNRLTAIIGGAFYEEALQREIHRIKSAYADPKQIFVREIVQRSYYDEVLEKAFGSALSEVEKDMRQTHLWMDACFHIIDDLFADRREASQRKALLLRSLYKNSGLIQ